MLSFAGHFASLSILCKNSEPRGDGSVIWDPRTSKKGSGFKPKGVQVKALPVLCR